MRKTKHNHKKFHFLKSHAVRAKLNLIEIEGFEKSVLE
jgi:hypothetical protein